MRVIFWKVEVFIADKKLTEILGLIKEDGDNTKTHSFMEEDIEDILKNNSRIAKYSLINGTYTFSKSSFIL